ncbi:hypothetical protein SS05631_b58760 (plasmid) [Sinorhizobium sp. CCBAU 05631]|nr:hypothetical protein SS05631_b58760 [Sinorhizobium sp. CCBAU 05631]
MKVARPGTAAQPGLILKSTLISMAESRNSWNIVFSADG